MVDAVVFDMDGVLVDSEPVWERVRRRFVAANGGHWPADAQQRLMGMSTAEWSAYMAADFGLDFTPAEVAKQIIGGLAAVYTSRLPLLPGAVDAVRRLAARWPLAVASSSPASLIAVVLDAADLRSAFTATVSSEEVPRGKPAPDVYLEAVARLGADPKACVAVEDSSNGLRAATAAGLAVIAIPRPEYPPAPDALQHARVILDSLTALTPETLDGI